MQFPDGLRYTKEHEWIKVDGGTGKVGITDFAQHELGDVVFVELPEIGAVLEKGKALGVVESVKAVSDIYAPLGGTVTAVNGRLGGEPELVNHDPYERGWMVELQLSDPAELADLMEAEAYREYVKAGEA